MLPRAEVENLLTAVFEPVELAAEGRITEGFVVLLLGKAKALEGEANFERPDVHALSVRDARSCDPRAATLGRGRVEAAR
jgi:hypothetical protein